LNEIYGAGLYGITILQKDIRSKELKKYYGASIKRSL
jgi:hypothetical protein